MIDKHGIEKLQNMNEKTLYNAVLSEAEKLGYSTSPLKKASSPFASKFEKVLKRVDADDFDSIYDVAIEVDPLLRKEIEIAKTYSKTSNQIELSRVVEYSGAFRDVIVKSDIPLKSKVVLQTMVSVGAGSSVLWIE